MNDKEFGQMLTSIWPMLFKHCMQTVRNRSEALDAVQHTMMRAWEKRATFDPTRYEKPVKTQLINWTYCIARNYIFSIRRRERIVPFLALNTEAMNASYCANFDSTLLLNDYTRAMAQLPRHQQDVLLSVARGDTFEELARASGVPIGTVKSRNFRARIRLKELMA